VSSSEQRPAREVVALRAGELVVRDAVVRTARADETVVRVHYGGICGSDLHYWRHGAAGESVLREPLRLGHEIVGVVVRSAADGSGFREGTSVAVHPATADSYLGSAALLPHTQGGFADTLALPSRMLRRVPASVDLKNAALAEPAAVALHAVRQAGDLNGMRTMVVGCGPIGLLVIAAAIRAGAAEVIAVDRARRPLEVARGMGAAVVAAPDDLGALSPTPVDVAWECSGTVPGLATSIAHVRRRGRVVMLGLLPPGPQPAPISLAITRELELVGSFRFTDEIDEVLDALADGSLEVAPVISHVLPVGRAIEAFGIAADSTISSKVLLDFSQ
jgi:2-desacetyl-2-hydroxyethyl bacteriochlorophyllide A dehydrogenase